MLRPAHMDIFQKLMSMCAGFHVRHLVVLASRWAFRIAFLKHRNWLMKLQVHASIQRCRSQFESGLHLILYVIVVSGCFWKLIARRLAHIVKKMRVSASGAWRIAIGAENMIGRPARLSNSKSLFKRFCCWLFVYLLLQQLLLKCQTRYFWWKLITEVMMCSSSCRQIMLSSRKGSHDTVWQKHVGSCGLGASIK